ncbi:YqhR family membrane protein [Sediminibacillus massiliensis]|uniref:YqhR family membrane protein n=1 Tax=Sediminibacillus massiliensis TaxID=1926277 RepID=UPI0009885503|nr:YqhR family membrane protein [Sediminibacillus massiliensis]
MGKQHLEQNKQEKPVSFFGRALFTGFIGGVIWSFFGAVASYFNFASVSPATFILRSWLDADWTGGWRGELLSIFIIGLLSILTAVIFYGLGKNMDGGIWPSAIFGLALWFVIFYLFQPIFPNIPHMTELNSNTVVTTICLYLLYGTFIGYSIAYNYQDIQKADGNNYSKNR